MPERTLDELKELAKPALRHAELVNLARTETPNKADEMALVRWPRRQAKATRFLAMLRRDYGLGAFEALVLSLEHARPEGAEHAQGGSVMVGLDDLYPVGVQNVAFKPYALKPKDIVIWVFTGDKPAEVSFDQEVTRLELTAEKRGTLVRRIVDAMFSQWANPKIHQGRAGHAGSWSTALMAVREYLADDREYCKKVLSATVIYLGGWADEPAELAYAVAAEALSKMKQTDEDKNFLSGLEPNKALNLVLQELLRAGFSEKEIMAMWPEMLMRRYKRNFLTACIVGWWRNLKFGEGRYFGYAVAEEVSKLCLIRDLEHLVFNSFRDTLSPHHCNLEIIYKAELEILDCVAMACGYEWCNSKDTIETFEHILVRGLARGQAAKVSIILARLGRCFGLYNTGVLEKEQFLNSLHRLMWGAIDQAVEDRNFGVACALAEYLGETEQADELRDKARHLNQRVALDFTFYTREDR